MLNLDLTDRVYNRQSGKATGFKAYIAVETRASKVQEVTVKLALTFNKSVGGTESSVKAEANPLSLLQQQNTPLFKLKDLDQHEVDSRETGGVVGVDFKTRGVTITSAGPTRHAASLDSYGKAIWAQSFLQAVQWGEKFANEMLLAFLG